MFYQPKNLIFKFRGGYLWRFFVCKLIGPCHIHHRFKCHEAGMKAYKVGRDNLKNLFRLDFQRDSRFVALHIEKQG